MLRVITAPHTVDQVVEIQPCRSRDVFIFIIRLLEQNALDVINRHLFAVQISNARAPCHSIIPRPFSVRQPFSRPLPAGGFCAGCRRRRRRSGPDGRLSSGSSIWPSNGFMPTPVALVRSRCCQFRRSLSRSSRSNDGSRSRCCSGSWPRFLLRWRRIYRGG